MPSKHKPSEQKPSALFWDESFLWGLMAWRALTEAGLPFDLIRSQDIRAGALSDYAMIFVPGGWAQAKVRALGKKGQVEIHRFVENGGNYLGICGGAGLATDSHLGLLPVCRTPNADRVPSFSGPISLQLSRHPIWQNLRTPVFSAWWPLQLSTAEAKDLHVLARYGEAEPCAMSADIRIEDGRKTGWSSLEKQYGIFLDPERFAGEPAVVEGACGKGKVILSLVHFDTPGDPNGALVFKNLWQYLTGLSDFSASLSSLSDAGGVSSGIGIELSRDIQTVVNDLIAEGMRRRLWRRRNDLLLQWRRGVRGMEYSTLSALTQAVGTILFAAQNAEEHRTKKFDHHDSAQLRNEMVRIRERLLPFAEYAQKLLRLEQEQPVDNTLSIENGSDDERNRLSLRLFGSARHFGGEFKPLIEALDSLLFKLLAGHKKPRHETRP